MAESFASEVDGQQQPQAIERVAAIDENEDDDNAQAYARRYYNPPKQPLPWLSHSSTPGKDISSIQGLYIDAQPVRLVNTKLFGENTEKKDLTLAIAVATILWNWHPNAFRALLDLDRFYSVVWARTVTPKSPHTRVIIERNCRALTVGFYSPTRSQWVGRGDIGIEPSGKWTVLSAMMHGSYIANPVAASAQASSIATHLLYDKSHDPRRGETLTLEVSDLNHKAVGGWPTDPHGLYGALDPSACVQCRSLPVDSQRSGGFQVCNKCHKARYCSRRCQEEDWKVHKGLCGKAQTSEQEE